MKRAAPIADGEVKVSGKSDRLLSMDPPVQPVRVQLEKILASRTFARAGRLSRFLRFSVEQTLQGHGDQIKEYLLGTEVFDKDQAFDPRIDPIVRVEAARLRSKLKEYYEKEGQDDPVLITLSKGSYAPQFLKPAPPLATTLPPSIRIRPDRKTLIMIAALPLLAGAVFWIALLHQRNRALQRELATTLSNASFEEFAPIWGRFFLPGADNIVVFGSPMFFSSQGHNLFLRFAGVNDAANLISDPNFRMLQEQFGPLSGPRYDYTEMGDAIALQRLTGFFAEAGAKLTALPAHMASWDAVRERNIIFLGAPRMNPLLQRLPVQQEFEWGADHKIRNRHPQPGESSVYETLSHRDAFTYATISSFPGLRPDRDLLLLTAHSTPGTLAAIGQVTQLENVRSIRRRLQLANSGERQHFQILLRVVADKNAPVKTEFVTHRVASYSPDKK
ncbi:MAG: hypothetical protein L0338_17405 [Acidobacteria bacterium]|nr:hypothetical protein [Acidobacteriota bacterium]